MTSCNNWKGIDGSFLNITFGGGVQVVSQGVWVAYGDERLDIAFTRTGVIWTGETLFIASSSQ